jgi:hypothetical protein
MTRATSSASAPDSADRAPSSTANPMAIATLRVSTTITGIGASRAASVAES